MQAPASADEGSEPSQELPESFADFLDAEHRLVDEEVRERLRRFLAGFATFIG